MKYAKIYGGLSSSISPLITIEADIQNGLNSITIVGLASKEVTESKDRVSSAIKNSGFKSPKNQNEKLVISLTPADVKKEGALFDLPIAISYILASSQIKIKNDISNYILIGELNLNGQLQYAKGLIDIIDRLRLLNYKNFIVPSENEKELYIFNDHNINIMMASNLQDVTSYIAGEGELDIIRGEATQYQVKNDIDMSDVIGQEHVKRALLIAALGKHNILLIGPPGTGKTMLARAFTSILPPLENSELLETMRIYSLVGIQYEGSTPFRSPHHTSSHISIVGGGSKIKPGEITLAHNGVLFMDEFPHFEKRVLESLREPLEDKKVRIARSNGSEIYPSDFILIAAMNPCPCGYYLSGIKDCICTPIQIAKYNKKISGPIIDRIDIAIHVGHIDYSKMHNKNKSGLTSNQYRDIIINNKIKYNAPRNVSDYIIDNNAMNTLKNLSDKYKLSPRSYKKILKLSYTISVLENSDVILNNHILEAFQYRLKDLD